ncbi:hypothetical protein AB0I94_09075 [Streptomyces sp. NPDC050147]|uniref:hypothetical protein n=1 Tax=Streptomyces sp. NPDC050147 TaxID=3155513 RepID=UPI00343BE59A
MQGTPHIASTPHDGRLPSVSPYPYPSGAAPTARRPPAAAPQLPVFIDQSGRRRRALQGFGLLVGCASLGYLLFAGTLISGLWQPVGTHPPSTDAPASSGVNTDGLPAGARADRDEHRHPPAARSTPPTGVRKQ